LKLSKEKIKKIAIKHFNQFGYEGTIMAQLAEEAGMRKQSLSYHYPTKKELFLEVYKEVVEEEILFVQHYFREHAEETLENQLYNFLTEHKNRFLTNPNAAFMLGVSFIAPMEVYDYVISQSHLYIGTLKDEIGTCFAKYSFRLSSEECTLAYVTLLDGLDIQLVYETRQTYERAQQIAWSIFWAGIQA
jgi:TetR/AcrR family transcriptional regulator, biofilm operon repressor